MSLARALAVGVGCLSLLPHVLIHINERPCPPRCLDGIAMLLVRIDDVGGMRFHANGRSEHHNNPPLSQKYD